MIYIKKSVGEIIFSKNKRKSTLAELNEQGTDMSISK